MSIGLGNRFGRMGSVLGRAGTTRQPTYYFSAAGSDANDGKTLATPKQTITAFNALTLVATDYVVFRKGDTFSGNMVIPASGSVLSQIIIGSYGIGANPIVSAAINTNGIAATNKSYITVDGVDVIGAGGTSGHGIYFLNSSGTSAGWVVKNLTASGFAGSGIFANVTAGSVAGVTITNCTANANTTGLLGGGSAGIYVFGVYGAQASTNYSFTNVAISGCTASNNTGVAGDTNWNGSGIVIAEVNGGLITNCTAFGNGGLCNSPNGPVGIWTFDSKLVTIQFCESYNNLTATSTTDGGGFDLDGGTDNCIIQYCYSHGNFGCGFLAFSYDDPGNVTGCTNNTIRFNISENDCLNNKNRQGGIELATATTNANSGLQVYGNTVYASSTTSGIAALEMFTLGGSLTGTVANNIFYAVNGVRIVDTAATNPSGMVLAGNNYFAIGGTFHINWNGVDYTTYASWQTATGQEKIAGNNVGFNVDPALFTAGGGSAASYKLLAASPMLTAGLNLNAQFSINPGTRDYFGGGIGVGNYPIGAGGSNSIGSTFVPWTPLNDTGLVEWWDTTNAPSITLNGTKISSWVGRLGSKTAVQATGANQPVYTGVTLNGVQAVQYTGSPVNLRVPAFAQPAAWTMVSVGNVTVASGTQQMVSGDNGVQRQAQYLRNNAGSLDTIGFNTVPTAFTSTKTGWSTSIAVVGSRRLAASITATLNGTDATPTATTGTSATANVALTFGASSAASPANFFTGVVGDIIFTSTTSTPVKQKMEGFEAWKFGLQASLPAGHPYASHIPWLDP